MNDIQLGLLGSCSILLDYLSLLLLLLLLLHRFIVVNTQKTDRIHFYWEYSLFFRKKVFFFIWIFCYRFVKLCVYVLCVGCECGVEKSLYSITGVCTLFSSNFSACFFSLFWVFSSSIRSPGLFGVVCVCRNILITFRSQLNDMLSEFNNAMEHDSQTHMNILTISSCVCVCVRCRENKSDSERMKGREKNILSNGKWIYLVCLCTVCCHAKFSTYIRACVRERESVCVCIWIYILIGKRETKKYKIQPQSMIIRIFFVLFCK